MQTILGAGGHIGRPLAKALRAYTPDIRLVSRRPTAVHPDDQLVSADLLKDDLQPAVAGSDIVYLVVGLPYRDAFWQKHWNPMIERVIAACQQAGAKLVFFDNVYLYAPDQIDGMTEQSRIAPATRKGRIRARVVEQIWQAHRAGHIEALIARAADFYGPDCTSSVIHDSVVVPAARGKTMRWLYDADQPHNFTYTIDAARATAQLGNDPKAYGRSWHLPSSPALTGREWMKKFWTSAGTSFEHDQQASTSPQSSKPIKAGVAPAWLLYLVGRFNTDIAALHRMRYQYQQPYRLDDSDFVKRYGWSATPVDEALDEIIQAARNSLLKSATSAASS